MSRLLAALLFAVSLTVQAAAAPNATMRCPDGAGGAQSLHAKWNASPEGIWYASIGRGRPILFVHGWTMDHRDEAYDYEPILRRRGGWRRVYVDLPGMGRSAATPVSDQDEMLRRLLAFVDREFAGARFAVSGTSAGAYLAHALAVNRRDRITGVLLRMPLFVPDDAKRDVDEASVLVEGDASVEVWPTSLRAAHGEAVVRTRCYVEALARKNAQRVAAAQALANRQMLDPIRNDPSRYALSLPAEKASVLMTAPALFISGRQDESVGFRDAWRMLARYPRATYVALDRAEHGFPVDSVNRAIFQALIVDWLTRVEEASPAGTAR